MSESSGKETEVSGSKGTPPGSPSALARHGSSTSTDNGRRRRMSLDEKLNPHRLKKPPTPPHVLTPPLPPTGSSGRRLSSSSSTGPVRPGRARTSSNAPRERSLTEEDGHDDLDDEISSIDSEVSYQSIISTPYQTDGSTKGLPTRGSAINLTHVYDELYKNEKRRETLREIVEFHASRRQLRRNGGRVESLLVQAASGAAAHQRILQKATSSPSHHGSRESLNSKPEFLRKSLSLRRKASAKDLYGNPISPRLNTLERWSQSNLLNDATDDDDSKEDLKSDSAKAPGAGSPNFSLPPTLHQTPTNSTSAIVKGIRQRRKLFQGSRTDVKIIRLPRGGVVVNSRIGAIQVGMPPETIKDSMNMGLPIPTIFVIPQQRFHRWRMISVAEFEFPAYFNFFVLKRAVRLVTTKAAEVAIRAAFQESLLGPLDLSMESIADDFDPNLPLDLRPNINAERQFFGKNNIDALLNFVTLKEVRSKSYLEADLGDGIYVRLEANEGEDSYVIVDKKVAQETEPFSTGASPVSQSTNSAGNTPNASPSGGADGDKKKPKHRRSVSDIQEFPSAPTRTIKRRGSSLGPDLLTANDGEVLARVPDTVELPNFRTFGFLDTRPEPFVPPAFGVTFLGTSHGFDPKSSTTGFVVWINGVGMLVDPPPNSGPMLELMGIPPRIIRNVLVTHCHADHDAGTMQKIMLDENVTVVTTPTIVNSFLRKYSALASIPITDIKKRFIFRSARVGQWMDLFGGEIRVFYAFHTIPCVGFEVRFGGKSIVYSADTFYEPSKIRELCEQKILTERRAQALIDFPWDADLILHECGVPPIHTPLQCLTDLSEDIKSRLFLVHVTSSTVPPDTGMRVAKEGVENTLVLDTSYSVPPLASAITVVGWMRDAAPLRDMRIEQLMDLLTVTRLQDFSAGEVVTEAVKNDSFLIVGSGAAAMFPPGKRIDGATTGDNLARAAMQADISLLVQGDCVFIGGHKCVNPEDRPYIVATSQTLRCALFQTADVECFAREGNETYNLVMKWKSEASLRDKFSDIDVLDCLTLRQRALFTSLFTEANFKRGDKLWTAGESPKYVYVLTSGCFELTFQTRVLDEDKEKKMDGEEVNEPTTPMTPSVRREMWGRSTSSGMVVPGRSRPIYDAQQKKEAYQQFANLANQLEEFSKGQRSMLFMCDLPALYHELPATSDLVVTSVYPKPKGFVASAANLLSFLRSTPQLLFRMHAEFVSENRRVNLEEEEDEEIV